MKNLYEKLVSSHKQICGIELYASFLQSIFHNDDLSNLMLRKIETIKINDFKSAAFSEQNGILLVSVDSISFGEIVYINDPALYILKTSRLDTIGKSFTKFIPLQYRLNHDTYIHEFVQNCTNPDVTNHHDFFLENDEGFLFECQLIIRFTPMYNKVYILISIKPLNTSRQMALISNEGIIQNHTNKFPYFVGCEGASAKNRNISEFISNFSMHSINTLEPKIEMVDNHEIALIHSEKIIKDTKIHTFTIIYSEDDMHIWKREAKSHQVIYLNNNNDTDTAVYYCNWMPSINQKMYENIKSVFKITGKLPQVPIENNDNIDAPKDSQKTIEHFSTPKDLLTPLSKDRYNSASNSQSNSAQRFVTKVIQESENRIKFFQSIFFFSVLAVACSNIGILIYIYDEVDHTSSLKTFEHLGEILYLIVSSADFVVSISYHVKNGQLSNSSNVLNFNRTILQLNSLKDSIRTDYADWSYCQNSDISIKPLIPVWKYENNNELKMVNFYDAIQEFIIKGNDFISKVETSSDNSNEMKFIIKNSLGFMYEYSDSALEGLVSCEKDRISGQGANIGAFLGLGVGIITLFLAFLIIQILSINKRYQALWDTVMKVARLFGVEEKYILIERLAEVHGIDYASLDNNCSSKKSHEDYKKLSFKVLWRYAWRLSIFFLVSVTFYLVIYFVLYAHCEEFMVSRPVILQTFTKQRALLSRMSLFARDINIPVNEGLFASSYSFKNPKTELVNSASLLNDEILSMRDSRILDLASEDLKKRIFEYSEIDVGILKYGTISATNSVIFQAFSLGSGLDSSSEAEIHNFILDISQIQQDADINFGLANHESKKKIEDILGNIIQITIAYSVGSILVFICFYWPFLISERKILIKIQNFTIILPAKIIFNKKKDII
ncbi:unnamed protein product [Blepharisma stoltei]|uniref:Uncharacterized protein n=1 Tax=Blepharisma stoltei TaxID=1481888 RepID=A0AAU9J9N9_9CILI|nr:unnamed protein product [Blepharisma stoltei]